MALCLASSLISCQDFDPYDQMVRYNWWYRHGYMSSTGTCFDIGKATRASVEEFEHRQRQFAKQHHISMQNMSSLSKEHQNKFDIKCGQDDAAGNGALMRLAPVPLFFRDHPLDAVPLCGYSAILTHGDERAYDACRYYGALIIAALRGDSKEDLLAENFYELHQAWFGDASLCDEVKRIAKGSFKREGGYDQGIRGKGYVVDSLEAALWAFWSDENSFEKGACAAVNLGDDTDTTAAIYGQLAGAHYGFKRLPENWIKQIYAKDFILNLSEWIAYEGSQWCPSKEETDHNLNPSTDVSSLATTDKAVSKGPSASPKQYSHREQREEEEERHGTRRAKKSKSPMAHPRIHS